LMEIATFTSVAALSLSPDRYHGHYGIQAIIRDIGPSGGWPTLTKTNYVEYAAVMRVRLQVRHMWEAVRYDDVELHAQGDGLQAKPARDGHLPAGQWKKHPANGCLRR
jgi:hypothetical protein